MTNLTETAFFEQSVREQSERIPSYNMFNRIWHNIRKYIVPLCFKTKRTYEDTYNQYYIVMVPLKGRDHTINLVAGIYKKNGLERICITKEIMAGAPHYNVIVTTKYDYTVLHKKVYKKFKLDVQKVTTISSINRIIDYMFKESKHRDFKHGIDYHIYCKST